MRTLIFALANTLFVSITCSTPQEEDISRALERITALADIQNWVVASDPNTITLHSKFSIRVSDSNAIAVVETSADNRSNGNPTSTTPFTIQIHFLPFSNYADLETQLTKRAGLVSKLNKDAYDIEVEALSDEDWERTKALLDNTPLPTHVAGDSLVYFSTTLDNTDLSIEPSEELKNGLWMTYRLGFLFSEIVK